MAILRRRLRCHYCNVQARDSVSHIPPTFLCPHCDAVNHFDHRGNITDPPAAAIATAPSTSFQYRHSREPSPVMSAPAEDLFCESCQRNQTLLANLLAEYLPDENDPDYSKYEAAYDEYKLELEDRYPQVCQACLPRVQDQIRNTAYTARADHLRRVMEKSEQRRTAVPTPRQKWTLRIISVAKWSYIWSNLVGVLWHILGYIMAPDEGIWADKTFRWNICLSQAVQSRSVDEACVLSSFVTKLQYYAIAADFLTIWWNPKLQVKTNSLTGRMRGLKTLWTIRIVVVLLRLGSILYWQRAVIEYNTIDDFRYTHLFMLGILAVSSALTWKTVRIVYSSRLLIRRLEDEHLLSALNSAQKATRETYRTAHPQPNIYDNMAQTFTSGFQDTSALPPSPTLTATSHTSWATTEATTPFGPKRTYSIGDGMDWTPTRPTSHFAAQPPPILPPRLFAHPSSPPPPAPHEPHSIFTKRDPNPFRHKVPAAPKAPAAARADPWKPGIWAPPVKGTTPNFFKEEKHAGGGVGEAKGLDGVGVPRNVKRDAEMFASPKFRYEYFGTVKDTGLEDEFNGLFSN